ncbi:hypothetical protein ATK74_2417 [Propionicimonas paludicola]|uniref:CDP-glycerol:poly(Glycerophosphate) glycerophosphotransferase n=1 Tax=Propionicimonas paludicola TaxID=185243 RepID=A0A2A9CW27_9ACTN|nr:hypothetical protein [Propionicimonas paludicola]PFG17840.1 hypothetical protein ATK74_2417 [Propionicimonas paludicola]
MTSPAEAPALLAARGSAWIKRANAAGLTGWQPLTVMALVAIGIVGSLGTAVMGWIWLFCASIVIGVLADQLAERLTLVQRLLDRAQLNLVARSILREFALLLVLTRIGWPEDLVIWAALLVFLVILARSFLVVAERQVVDLQTSKILTRNLLSSADEAAAQPVRSLEPAKLALIGSVPIVLGGLPTVVLAQLWPLLVASVLYVLFAGAWSLWRVAGWLRSSRRGQQDRLAQRARAAVDALRPQVLVYFSGESDALYQLAMWLPVLRELDPKTLVVLRERANLAALPQTDLPVICIPNASELMDFRLPTVRVAFYVAHVGKNIHMLREPRMKHVFIGHGESDKTASVNPATKAMDEVWVAGRASRERWAAAKVGVRDEAIVEVGRPQLGGIRPAEPRDGRPLSVLYAPTWEGWSDDPGATSIVTMGPSLVRWLTERPQTRVIYRPHPLTGRVSAAARRAHLEVLSIIEAAGGRALSAGPASADDWAAATELSLVVDGDQAPLYDCFNNCDVLIGDISSVVPDFQASGKPYFIPNTRGWAHQTLRDSSASARAAYLLDPDAAGWEQAMLDASGADPLAADRAALRQHLLGPVVADPLEPWRVAVRSLISRAEAEWPDAENEALATQTD